MKRLILCTSFALCLSTIPVSGQSGRDKGADNFDVLPNPGSGLFTVLFKSELKTPQMLAVYDATGKYVFLKTIRDYNGELKETVDLLGSPKGVYIFEVEWNHGRDVKKVIIQ